MNLPAHLTWKHVVYGGVFGQDLVYEQMAQIFGSSDVDFDERVPRGDTALFSLVVDAQGQVDLESLVLSTAAWGLGRAKSPGPGNPAWLNGFETDSQHLQDAIKALLAKTPAARKASPRHDDQEDDREDKNVDEDDDSGKPAAVEATDPVLMRPQNEPVQPVKADSRSLEYADLAAITQLAVRRLGLSELTARWSIRIQTQRVPVPKPGSQHNHGSDRGEDGFLNSFHLEDLEKVANALAAGNAGQALKDYLTDEANLDVDARQNVREPAQLPLLRHLLAPARVPSGRWPSNVSHPLASSQQLAIGQILDQLGEGSGIFAVNGPPGTGKTTMLRDLLSAVVVARAEQLAALDRPQAAFPGSLRWKTDQRTHHVWQLKPALTGFEMVIASENNGAVENVSRQIPAASEIDEEWRAEADYFAEHATRLLKQPAWGLVAAPLGNMTNRTRFAQQFWYGNPESGPHNSQSTSETENASPGFNQFLFNADSASIDWAEEVRAFRDTVAVQDRLRAERVSWERTLTDHSRLQAAQPHHQTQLERANSRTAAAEQDLLNAQRLAAASGTEEQAAAAARTEHTGRRPGLVEIIFTWGKAARRWHAEDEQLVQGLTHARQRAQQAARVRDQAEAALTSARATAATARQQWEHHKALLADAEAVVQACRGRWNEDFPDESWWMDERRRELAGPWLDEEWNRARSEVFLAALRLHAAFITGTASLLRQNLATAIMLLQGKAPRDLSEPIALAAWQSLFLVVPVVSTTFSSLPRLLRHLGREALGWLFIDEAGQARPQAVVGALWRSRRVVAVGDPLQLEPVMSVLNTTQQALRRHYGVADTWTPVGTCAQSLADRLTTLGTSLPGPDNEPVWVGAPLRVHRRCGEPMFSLVNELAYDQMMVHATPPRANPLTVENTRWVDVSGPAENGNWVPAEGDAADQILDYLLHQQGLEPGQIFVISPFRAVVTGLQRRLTVHGDRGVKISTVHKTQGQERDIVVLVLGSDPERPGARTWAAQKPNLLNVAVSRAKQRLYVIGNHNAWASQPHFALLAHHLDRKPFTQRSRSR